MHAYRRSAVLVAVFALVFALGAWTLTGFAPPSWYATAAVRPGVYAKSEPRNEVAVTSVESVAAMLERVNSHSFRFEALSAAGLGDDVRLRRIMDREFSARVLPAAQLLEMRIGGRTAEEARRLLEALIMHLQAAHAKEIEPSVMHLERLLAAKRDEQKALGRYVGELDPARVVEPGSLRRDFGANAAFASLYVSEAQARLPRIAQEIILIESSLASIARNKTEALGSDVDVLNRGWSQRRGVATIGAALVGAVFGWIVSALTLRRTRPTGIANADVGRSD